MAQSEQNPQIRSFLLAAAGVILFSTKAIFVKKAYEYQIDVISLLLIRMLFSLPFFIVIAAVSTWRVRNRMPVNAKHLIQLTCLGIAGYYLSSYLDFSGLKFVTAGLERLILFAYPTLVVIITAIFYRERIPFRQLLAIVITYFGIFLAFFQNINLTSETDSLKGGILIACCAFTYACYLVGSEKLIPILGSVRFTAYVMIIATAAVAIHFTLQMHKPVFGYPYQVYLIGIGMAIFSTVMPSFMISEALRQLGASNVAIIGSIGPFATILMAAIFLGERITVFEGLGTLIVISGVLLVKNSGNKQIKTASENNRMAA
jgi:drug/metabolite transporter (DMT)-like permease